MIILNLFYFFMPLTIILAFTWAPAAEFLGESSRILYFHVPLAWISTLAFLITGIFSVIYLCDKEKRFRFIEEKVHNAATLGMLFMILALITGSIWSRISWGAYWNWDPRQTSIVILILIYLAYFSLRAVLADNPARGKLISSYLIIAAFTMPFFIFIIPRVYASLHPDPVLNQGMKINLDIKIALILLLSTVSFTLLFFNLLSAANRVSIIKSIIEEKSGEI